VETTSLRDNRMGWRRLSVLGGHHASQPAISLTTRAIPHALENSGGLGAKPPSPTAETPRNSPAPDRRVRARGSLSPRGPQGAALSAAVPSLITSPGQE
jgi:hypothetical protein